MPAALFHGGIIKADVDDGISGHEGGAKANDPSPELRTMLVQGPA
jgi:hypothetical protein